MLAKTATALEIENRPEQDELLDVLKNMPRFDLGNLEIEVGPSAVASLLGRRWAVARVERRIRSQAGEQITDAVGIYARVLQAWVRKTFTELQERFDSYADAYRAHLDRLAANKTGVEDEQALRDDLAALAAAAPETRSRTMRRVRRREVASKLWESGRPLIPETTSWRSSCARRTIVRRTLSCHLPWPASIPGSSCRAAIAIGSGGRHIRRASCF